MRHLKKVKNYKLKVKKMKRFKIKILMTVAFVGMLMMYFSCDRDELFEREQYKKVFALLRHDNFSSSEFNIFAEVHDLDSAASQGWVSATVGGTLPTGKDISIAIMEDEELFATYNISNYGEGERDRDLYARRLPRGMYDIATYSITIPAGERFGRMGIKVRPDGLNPDSVYYIPLSIDRFSAYEINPDRRTLLYRVFMKNFYATNRSEIYYSSRFKIDSSNRMASKRVFPVRRNSVRTMAGELPFGNHLDTINSSSMLLTVAEDNSVRIEAWKNLNISRVDGDPDYPNIFLIHDDGYKKYKTFLLCYDYTYGGETHRIQEELRLEFREEIDY
jgi:hypothetical protein